MASTSAAQLRGALARYREQARHGRFPDDLRELAASYAQERLRAGAEPPAVARELGVSVTTVRAWGREGAHGAPVAPVAMVPLMVRPGVETAMGARLEVAFPDGTKLQVTGMAGRELVDTIVALRGPR